jgi:hypothetical protein
MPRRSRSKPGEKPQFERFIEAAKNSGAAEVDDGLTGAVRKAAAYKLPDAKARA